MKNRFTLFAMLLISTGILAQSPVKVDFDKDERALDEVHERVMNLGLSQTV